MIKLKPTAKTKKVLASEFSELEIPYRHLNPIQSAAYEYIRDDVNIVVSTPTGSGKTLVAAMATALALKEGNSALYASPYKALTEERRDEWQEMFPDATLVTMTGDYAVTDKLKKKLARADLILLTSEMVDSKARQGHSEKLQAINKASVIVVDEIHLICDEGRGDKIETGLMALTHNNPNIRLIFLSATLKNGEEIANWATKLNGKETVLIESKWRPTKLHLEFITYNPPDETYHADQVMRVETALKTFFQYPEDCTAMFVHTKKDGRDTVTGLYAGDVEVPFYNADLDLKARKKIMRQFLGTKINPLVATSAASTGVNMPCKTAIIVGTRMGLQEVKPMKITQAIGRAGRIQFEKEGFARIVVNAKDLKFWERAMKELPDVKSQLSDYRTLRFHIVSLIDRERAATALELTRWHEKSLMAIQGRPMRKQDATAMLEGMQTAGIIFKKRGRYKNTFIGKIASRLYFDPFAIIDWLRNWEKLRDQGLLYDDTGLSWAVGRSIHYGEVHSNRDTRDYVDAIEHDVREAGLPVDRSIPMVAAIRYGLQGLKIVGLQAMFGSIRSDIWRMVSAWKWAADSAKLDIPEEYFDKVGTRLQSGGSWETANFCQVPGLGAVRAQRLVDEGVEDILMYLRPEKKGGMRETAKELMKRKPYSEREGHGQYYKVAKAMLAMPDVKAMIKETKKK